MISVITPVFNRKQFLEQCIDSVRHSQTFGEFQFEHVIVDDGSTDGSAELLLQLAKKYPHIRPVILEKNLGPSGARNRASDEARGEWIYFLDSDDLLFMHSLAHLFDVAKTVHTDWLYGGFLQGNTEAGYLLGNDYWGTVFASAQEALYRMYTGQHYFQHSFFVKRSLLVAIGGYNEAVHMGEDFDICTRWLLSGVVPHYVPGVLHMRRIHDDNLSKEFFTNSDKHRQNTLDLFRMHEPRLVKILTDEQLAEVRIYLGL